jgi:hypothetical protein
MSLSGFVSGLNSEEKTRYFDKLNAGLIKTLSRVPLLLQRINPPPLRGIENIKKITLKPT